MFVLRKGSYAVRASRHFPLAISPRLSIPKLYLSKYKSCTAWPIGGLLTNPISVYSFDVDERVPEESAAYPLTQVIVQDRGRYQDIDPWRRFFERRDGTNADM